MGCVVILSAINEVEALRLLKGKIVTEIARVKVSPMLTFENV